MNIAEHKLQQLQIYVSSKKAATMLGRDITWVQKNKSLFSFRRVNGRRNLEYELCSVLKVYNNFDKG